MKTLYIAEKPDIATAIAAHIWPNNYKTLKTKTCYTNDDTTVTWAFGHILMTAMPEAYGEQFKSFFKYPIYPEKLIKLPAPSAKEQLTAIKKMLKTIDVVVNGGDPDREGQLLIDEILEYCGYKGTVNRILINAKDEASMKRAFEGIVPDSKFRTLYEAGMAREQADWLFGMNLSRAYSVSAKKKGLSGVWRIGRVKVPTLALVVSREREIENFQPVDYFNLLVNYQKDGVSFTGYLSDVDDSHCDSEGRIIDKEYLKIEEVKYGESDDEIFGILFDGAWLWEEYINTILGKYGFIHPKNKKGKGSIWLFDDIDEEYTHHYSGRRYPDFYKDDHVLDAKYKWLEKCTRVSEVDRDDIHQVITYMTNLKVHRGGFIAPLNNKRTDVPTSTLKGSVATLSIHGVKISKTATSYSEFCEEMKEMEEQFVQSLHLQ